MPRPMVDFSSVWKSTYDSFIKSHPNVDISYKQYAEIIRSCNAGIADYIIENGKTTEKLPFGFNLFEITRFRPQKLPIDMISSSKLGKKILYLNAHTDGWMAHITWKRTPYIKLIHLWFFKPTRSTFARKLASILKSPDSWSYMQRYRDSTNYKD